MRRHRTAAAPPAHPHTPTATTRRRTAPSPLTHSALRRFLSTYAPTAKPEQRLRVARIALDMILRDRAACKALQDHGYDAKALQEGCKRLAHAHRRLVHRAQCERTLLAARHMDAVVQDRAFITYRRCFQMVRNAIRANPDFIDAVELALPRRRDLKLWQAHAHGLRRRMDASPELATLLGEYGFSAHLLTTLQQQLSGSMAGRELRHIAQARALLASRACAHALASFERWMHDFIVIAQLALAEQQSPLAALPLPVMA